MRASFAWLFLVSCGGVDTNSSDDTSTAYAAALSIDSAVQESGLIAAIATKLTVNDTTGMAAAADAATVTDLFMPAGCATTSTNLNVVTYTFSNCTGPYGLLKLNGTLTATLKPMAAGQVQVTLAASGFKISTVTASVNATALVTTGVTQDSAMVTSTSSATNARGETAVHSGSYTAGWDSSCLTLNGSFMTTLGTSKGTDSWSTQISNFRSCSGMCPAQGGSITVTSSSGGSVTVHYTNGGSAEVTTTNAGGTRGMIVLSCGAI
jgi:hypothetical protein